jgi:hypothetical protein
MAALSSTQDAPGDESLVFRAHFDDEGVYFYQAYNDDIANWALTNQRFGGPKFNATRMTWIKPSFAWVLYRSGYGGKHNQNRVLKVKMTHEAVANLLSQCQCKEGGGGAKGRIQWDPERDVMSAENKEPRRMLRERSIQIGLKGSLSEFYVQSVISIEDVTDLSHQVGEAHRSKDVGGLMAIIKDELPHERPYQPHCTPEVLRRIGILPGETSKFVRGLGIGKAVCAKSK